MASWLTRVALGAGAWLLIMSLAGIAHAQQPDTATRQKAGELFKTGTALASENRWREALVAFEQATLLVPHASTTYNMAYCERGLGQLTRARALFIRALAEDAADGGLSTDQQTSASSYRAEAERQIVRIQVEIAPPDAALSVDGRPLELESESPPIAVAGTRPPGAGIAMPAARFELWLDPGSHVLVIKHHDGRQDSITRAFGAGETATLLLELSEKTVLPPPPPPALPPASPEPVPPPEPAFWNGQRIGAAIVTGVGVGALAAGVVLGVRTAITWSEAQDACPNTPACPDDTAFERSLDAKRDGNLATVALITAGLAAAGATYLWWTAPSPSVEVGLYPAGVAVRGSF